MTIIAFLLILLSVFLHTGWNFLAKAHRPSAAFLFIANAVTILILLPFGFFVRLPWGALPGSFWLLLGISGLSQVVYACGIFKSYQLNDISVAYPMMRALPVIAIAVITTLFHIGQPPSAVALAGMAFVAIGCVILPQKDFRSITWKALTGPALLPIIIGAAGTTGYTLCDSQALACLKAQNMPNHLLNSAVYSFYEEVLVTAGLGLVVFLNPGERRELRAHSLCSIYPYLCGIFSCVAYLLVLFSMGYVTNISFLQAFRQMSLPIGVAAGILILHEKNSAPKMAGVFFVVLGLILTVL